MVKFLHTLLDIIMVCQQQIRIKISLTNNNYSTKRKEKIKKKVFLCIYQKSTRIIFTYEQEIYDID